MAKVYVKLDSNNVIAEINSDIFLESLEGYTLIDEGEGDKYAHAQNNYLPAALTDCKGKYNYTYYNGRLTLLTDAEKATLFPDPVPQSSDLEILGQMATDAELERIELGQRITDLELMQLEGGA